jgi:hypothetical protein
VRLGPGVRRVGVACLVSWLTASGCILGRADTSRASDGGEGTPAMGSTSDGVVLDGVGVVSEGGEAPALAPVADAIAVHEPASVEPCESHTSERECDAAGCIWFDTERVTDLSTCALEPAGFCAAASASTGDDDYDSAFYKRVGDVVHVRRVGHKSSDFPGPEHPAGWTECGRGGVDPAECGCVCAAGHCPGDRALDLLEACGSPRECADLPAGDLGAEGEACFYQALALQSAARLRVGAVVGDRNIEDRVYLRGDGTAMWLRSECDLRDLSCLDRKWELPRLCTLRDPAHFATCAAAEDPGAVPGCRDVAGWFGRCELAAATCP